MCVLGLILGGFGASFGILRINLGGLEINLGWFGVDFGMVLGSFLVFCR